MSRNKGRTGSPTNLYLDDDIKAQAGKLAFALNMSLSELVESELRKRLARHTKATAKVQQKLAA